KNAGRPARDHDVRNPPEASAGHPLLPPGNESPPPNLVFAPVPGVGQRTLLEGETAYNPSADPDLFRQWRLLFHLIANQAPDPKHRGPPRPRDWAECRYWQKEMGISRPRPRRSRWSVQSWQWSPSGTRRLHSPVPGRRAARPRIDHHPSARVCQKVSL